MSNPRPPLWVHSALFMVALLYAATFSIAKVAMPAYVHPAGFIALRVLCATVLLWAVAPLFAQERFHFGADGKRLALSACCGVAVNMLLFFEGLARTSPIHSAVIMVTTPLFVLAVGLVAGGELITWRKAAGLLIGAGGAVALVAARHATTDGSSWLGDFYTMLNAMFYAVYLIIAKPLMRQYHPITVMKWVFLLANIITLPWGFMQLLAVPWGQLPGPVWGSIAFVVFGSTFATYVLNALALSRASSSLVGAYIYLQPVLAAAIAAAAGTDSPTAYAASCAAAIFLGVWLVSGARRQTDALPLTTSE